MLLGKWIRFWQVQKALEQEGGMERWSDGGRNRAIKEKQRVPICGANRFYNRAPLWTDRCVELSQSEPVRLELR